MATCDTCGNTYDKSFTVTTQHASGVFDSTIYCCAHCAHHAGEVNLVDRT